MISSFEVLKKMSNLENFEEIDTKNEHIKEFKLKGTPYVLAFRNFFTFKDFSDATGEVRVSIHKGRTNIAEYTPDIYVYTDHKSNVESFSILTTSYGDLPFDAIEKVIKGYEIAVLTVKELNKIFE